MSRAKQHKLAVSLTQEQKEAFVALAKSKDMRPHALLKLYVLKVLTLQPKKVDE